MPYDSTSAEEELPQPPLSFTEECDLVMKGGITSGVVYPLAIVEIAKAFTLRSIGGTSAGAIAAAAAAAAELGRQRGQTSPGDAGPFEKLAKLPDFLGSQAEGGKGTRLLAFFRPIPRLAYVFNAFTASLQTKGVLKRSIAVILALQKHDWYITLVLLLLAAWWIAALPGQLSLPGWGLLIAVGAVVLAIGASVACAVWVVVKTLPRNQFGFCTGMPEPGAPRPQEPLTAWLGDYLDDLSEQNKLHPNKPLTFGDLAEKKIDLQVMTTCLTLGRPFRLPFRNDDVIKENNQFLFDEAEFRKLFPAKVVDWMVANPRPFDADGDGRLAQDIDFGTLKRLPTPENLPVAVAVRMSLSFPFLLCAIPLHAVNFREVASWRRQQEPRPSKLKPQPCWFTDGGVGSNFPIHFFDSPLPTRPTFGLDLGHAESPNVDRVVFPKDNGQARIPYWRHLQAVPGFAAIVSFVGILASVAKDWNHETLALQPGFRDRIGLIRLTDDEGGLNLTMPPERIAKLTEYGRQAGQEFVIRFGNPAKWPAGAKPSKMNWENHQAIRLRLLLATYTENVKQLEHALVATAGSANDYARFFNGAYGPASYRLQGVGNLGVSPVDQRALSQAGLALQALEALRSIAVNARATGAARGDWIAPAYKAPKPLPELRIRPRV